MHQPVACTRACSLPDFDAPASNLYMYILHTEDMRVLVKAQTMWSLSHTHASARTPYTHTHATRILTQMHAHSTHTYIRTHADRHTTVLGNSVVDHHIFIYITYTFTHEFHVCIQTHIDACKRNTVFGNSMVDSKSCRHTCIRDLI
jgi:hypothetical protein